MASSVNSARSGAQSVADDGAMSDEAFDGFIHLRDLSPVHDAYAPSDVAARELAAVDAILESLQDLEPLPTGFDQPTARDDARGMVGVSALGTPLPLVLAKLALAEAQGGMVMLELNEANSGDIDFSNIAESNATLPAFRSGVEAVVGFYQTVDVGGGEPAAETHPVGNASPNPTRQTQPANQYSNDEGSGTSRKSAAAIGISMLVGAMLWVAQRQQNGDNNAESESTKGERGKV